MSKPSATNRRNFLVASSVAMGAAALPTIVPASALGRAANKAAASERITLGVIGIGPRCKYVLGGMLGLEDVQCVAIADVQASRRTAGKEMVDKHYGNQDLKLYRDMREILDRKDIDAVLIATGDRWHGPASILAAEAGKDVYSEKPCGITIDVCKALADTIKKTGRVFQAGTQRRSVPNFIEAVKLAQNGKLGKIQTLYAPVYVPTLANDWLPREQTPPPEVVDWNMWLGPAPWRPFNQKYVEGGWRGIYDFDSGARLLDWGAHTVDLCQWAIKADGTSPVEYEPTETNITCRYESGVKLIIDFLKEPFGNRGPNWNTKLGTCPIRFVGDEGSVETGDNGGMDLTPASLEKEVPDTAKLAKGLDAATHARNFFDCVKSRQLPVANAEVMRRSHTVCHAAAIAWILNRKLHFDPIKEVFVSPNGGPDVEANSLRSRPARDPFA
jgi:predicted dehydrogenase